MKKGEGDEGRGGGRRDEEGVRVGGEGWGREMRAREAGEGWGGGMGRSLGVGIRASELRHANLRYL